MMIKPETVMTQEQLLECLERVDMKVFTQNPTQALIDARVTLKEGTTFQFVDTDDEANALPKNVFPLLRSSRSAEVLSDNDLDQVAGGHQGQGEHIMKNGKHYCTFLGRFY